MFWLPLTSSGSGPTSPPRRPRHRLKRPPQHRQPRHHQRHPAMDQAELLRLLQQLRARGRETLIAPRTKAELDRLGVDSKFKLAREITPESTILVCVPLD